MRLGMQIRIFGVSKNDQPRNEAVKGAPNAGQLVRSS